MALAYVPPGVTIEELYSPSVNPLLAVNAQVSIVGLARGYEVGTATANMATDNVGGTITLTAPEEAVFVAVSGTQTFEKVVNFNVPNAGSNPDGSYAEGDAPSDEVDFTADIAPDFKTITVTPTTTDPTPNSAPGTVEADDDTVTLNTHGYALNQRIRLVSLTNGAGLTAGSLYYVIAPTANTFKLSTTSGGSAVAVTTDGTALLFNETLVPPVDGSGLMDLDTGYVIFTYRFIHERYYEATRYNNTAGIESAYGPGFGPSGIVTPLSAACFLAFENGASSVVVQPLFKLLTPGDPLSARQQPVGADITNGATWQQTLEGLRDIEDINVLVPAFGPSEGVDFSAEEVLGVFSAFQDHAYFMHTQGQEIVCVFGEDSAAAAATATATIIRGHANILRSRLGGTVAENTVLVSPSRFKRASTTATAATLLIGGQYVAAAIAGMLANRPTSQPLTRKSLAGFVQVSDPRDRTAKDADAAAGLLVVEQRGQNIQVRHGLTIDTTSTARRELSVVRGKHRMVESIRDTLESQVIGTVPADGNAPMVVKQAVIGVLELLRQHRELVDYNGVQARTLSNDPSTVEVRFSYLPAFPLNYIHIQFSVDLSGGEVQTTFGDTAQV